jgi:hypothetical protein
LDFDGDAGFVTDLTRISFEGMWVRKSRRDGGMTEFGGDDFPPRASFP